MIREEYRIIISIIAYNVMNKLVIFPEQTMIHVWFFGLIRQYYYVMRNHNLTSVIPSTNSSKRLISMTFAVKSWKN